MTASPVDPRGGGTSVKADLTASADLVQRADPDRFLSAMAAPPDARAVLFPIYAFNIEISRAPWVTQEPMIAEMRLQWWRDALDGIYAGTPSKVLGVAELLSALLVGQHWTRSLTEGMIDARRWDIGREGFADAGALWDHIDRTNGHLMWLAARLLGADPVAEPVVRRMAAASGMAAWLRSVPDWLERGRAPLPDLSPLAIGGLADEGLRMLSQARKDRAAIGDPARAAMLAGWRAGPALAAARRDPTTVVTGLPETSEFRRRGGLLLRATTGRW